MFSKASRFNYPKPEAMSPSCCRYVVENTPKSKPIRKRNSTKSEPRRYRSYESKRIFSQVESTPRRCASCDPNPDMTEDIILTPIQSNLMTEVPSSSTRNLNDSDYCSSCSGTSAEILGIDLSNVGEMKCESVYEYLTALEETIFSHQASVDGYSNVLGPLMKSEESQCHTCSFSEVPKDDSVDLKFNPENVTRLKHHQNRLHIYIVCFVISIIAIFTYYIMFNTKHLLKLW